MPYSAVTQPPSFFHAGPRSSTLAVHSTRVSPKLTSTEPSACLVKPRTMETGRSWSAVRPEVRSVESVTEHDGEANGSGVNPATVRAAPATATGLPDTHAVRAGQIGREHV